MAEKDKDEKGKKPAGAGDDGEGGDEGGAQSDMDKAINGALSRMNKKWEQKFADREKAWEEKLAAATKPPAPPEPDGEKDALAKKVNDLATKLTKAEKASAEKEAKLRQKHAESEFTKAWKAAGLDEAYAGDRFLALTAQGKIRVDDDGETVLVGDDGLAEHVTGFAKEHGARYKPAQQARGTGARPGGGMPPAGGAAMSQEEAGANLVSIMMGGGIKQ